MQIKRFLAILLSLTLITGCIGTVNRGVKAEGIVFRGTELTFGGEVHDYSFLDADGYSLSQISDGTEFTIEIKNVDLDFAPEHVNEFSLFILPYGTEHTVQDFLSSEKFEIETVGMYYGQSYNGFMSDGTEDEYFYGCKNASFIYSDIEIDAMGYEA